MIECSGERIAFIATDLELQITTWLDAKPEEAADYTVSARKLLDIRRALPDETAVSLDYAKDVLKLQAGKSRFSLQTLPARDFPKLQSTEGEGTSFTIAQGTLRHLLARVQYAMAVQDIRYYLNGMLFSLQGKRLTVAATDGHRLALDAANLDMDQEARDNMITWLHYVGAAYKNKTRFLSEAKSQGISRRVPAQVARGFHFGDRVILLRHHSRKGVEAFGEMVINQVIFPAEIAKYIGETLQEQGKVDYSPGALGSSHIHRECGDYDISGSYTITQDDIDIPDLVKAAQELANGDTVFCMIGGKLIKTYDQPVWLFPAPKFTRGFIKYPISDDFFEYEGDNVNQIRSPSRLA